MTKPEPDHNHICYMCDREVKHYLKECGDLNLILCATCLANAFSAKGEAESKPKIVRSNGGSDPSRDR